MKSLLFIFLFVFTVLFSGLSYASEKQVPLRARYTEDARKTIEIGVSSIMKEMDSTSQLCATIDYFIRSWDSLADSELFVLRTDGDMEVYGNLYSLHVMCATLLLAAEDWERGLSSPLAEAYLEKAQWLEHRARMQAEPVAEILFHQSYNENLKLRVQIMQKEFGYVKKYYDLNSFKEVLAR